MRSNNTDMVQELYSNNYIERYRFYEDLTITHIKPYTKDVLNMFLTSYTNSNNEDLIRIILILSGEMEITIEYIKHKFPKRTLVEISPMVIVNNLTVSENFSCYEILASKSFINDTVLNKNPIPISHFMDMEANPGNLLSEENADTIKTSICNMLYYIKQDKHHYKKELLHNTFYNFILEIGNIFIDVEKNNPEPKSISRKDNIIKQFISLINQYGKKEHSPSFYSDKLCVSTQYLSLILKERSKNTAGDWIASYLITQAKIKLRTPGGAIQEIADDLNFADQASFGKFFKKHTGLSPKKYKEEYSTL